MGALLQETFTRAVIVKQGAPVLVQGAPCAGGSVPGPLRDCQRPQRAPADGEAFLGSVVGGALTTEADVSGVTDIAAGPAVGWINQ
jgi:hypothetical protein